LLTDIESELTASNVTITHAGGDTLKPENVEVIIESSNGNSDNIQLSNFSTGAPDSFEAGDSVRDERTDPAEFWIGEFRLLVVHEPSNTILHDEAKEIGLSGNGLRLEVEDKDVGLTDTEASVWGQPNPVLNHLKPGESRWDFKLTASFTRGNTKVLTDDLGESYSLSVGPLTPSTTDGVARGTLQAPDLGNADSQRVEVRAEYTSNNVPSGISNSLTTSSVNVTIVDPQDTFEVTGDIDDDTNNNKIRVNYTIKNTGDVTVEQNMTFLARAYDGPVGSSNLIDNTTQDSINGVSPGDLVSGLAPGETTSGSFNYSSAPPSTTNVKVTIKPEIGSSFQQTQSFKPATFEFAGVGASTDSTSFNIDYDLKNTGDLGTDKDVTLEVTAYNNGTQLDSTTKSNTAVQLDSGEVKTGFTFSVPIPSATNEVRYNISTPDDSRNGSLSVAPASYEVSDLTIDDIYYDAGSGDDRVNISYEITNNGGLADTQNITLNATDDTGSGFGSVDTTAQDTTVSLAPGESQTFTQMFHSIDPAAVGVKVEVVPELGSSATATKLNLDPPTHDVVGGSFQTVVVEYNSTANHDEFRVQFEVANIGDITYDTPQDVSLTFTNKNGAGSKTLDVPLQVPAGQTQLVTVTSDSIRSSLFGATTYELSTSDDNPASGPLVTQRLVEPSEFDLTIDSSSFDTSSEELVVDYTVTNEGTLTDDVTTKLFTLDAGGNRLGERANNTAADLTGGASTSGTLRHEVRESEITPSNELRFEVAAVPALSGSLGDNVTGSVPVAPPNFEIAQFDVTPNFGSEEVTVDYTVENTGDLTAKRDIGLTASVDGSQTDSDTKTAVELTPGEVRSETGITLNVTEPATAAQVNVTLDTQDQNQSWTRNVAPALFDISITSAGITNGVVSVGYSVENTGDFSDTQNITLAVEGVDQDTETDVALGPADSPTTGTLTSGTLSPPGDGEFDILVRASGNSDDASTTLSVTPPQIAVSISSLQVNGDEKLSFDYTVSNAGAADFSASRALQANVSGPPTVDAGVTNPVTIAPGNSVSRSGVTTQSALSSGGTYTIEVTYGSASASKDITVAGPNFDVRLSGGDPARVTGTGEATVDFTIKNTGQLTSGTQTITAEALADDTTATTQVGPLAPGEETSVKSLTVSVSSVGTQDVEVRTSGPGDSETDSIDVAGPSISVDVRNLQVQNNKIVWDYEVSNAASAELAATRNLQATITGPPAVDAGVTNPVTIAPGDSVSKSGLTTQSALSSGGTYTIEVTYGSASASKDITVAGPNFDVRLSGGDPARVTGTGEATVDFTIKNTGQLTSGTQTITAEALADDTTATTQVGPLAAGAETSVQSLTVPVSSPGTQDIEVRTSGPGDSERDSIDVAGPDISVSVTNLQLTGSNKLRFDYTVSNAGSAELAATRNLQATVTGSPAADLGVTNPVTIAPGDSVSGSDITTDIPVPSGGTYTVEVTYGGASGTEDITVAGPSITVDVRNLRVQNDKLFFDYEISNAASADLSATRDVTAEISGAPATGPGVSNPVTIAPGNSITRTLSSNNKLPGAGSYTAEITYGSASDSESLAVAGPAPSVDVRNLRTQNEKLVFDYEISNAASADLAVTGDVSASISGAPAAGPGISNPVTISPGDSVTRTGISSNAQLPAGDGSYTVEVDYSGASDSESISVSPTFEVSLVGGNPATYDRNSETAAIDFTVTNTGNIRGTPTATAEALNDNNENSAPLSELTPGETSSTGTISVDIDSAGTQDIEVRTADDSERDSIDVDPPNVRVTGMSAPGSVTAGNSVTFTIFLENQGGITGSGNVDVDLTSNCCVPDEPGSVSLGAGDTTSITWDYSTSRSNAPSITAWAQTSGVSAGDGDAASETVSVVAEPILTSTSVNDNSDWRCPGFPGLDLFGFCANGGGWHYDINYDVGYTVSDPSNRLDRVEISIENIQDNRGSFSSPAVYTPGSTSTTINHQNTEDGYCPYVGCPFSSDSSQTFSIQWRVYDNGGQQTDFQATTNNAAGGGGQGGDPLDVDLTSYSVSASSSGEDKYCATDTWYGCADDQWGSIQTNADVSWNADIYGDADYVKISWSSSRGGSQTDYDYSPSSGFEQWNDKDSCNDDQCSETIDATIEFFSYSEGRLSVLNSQGGASVTESVTESGSGSTSST
jgi:hypothetical protein